MSKQKFHAVTVGRVPGIYNCWDDTDAQVTGYSGSKHKAYSTYAEAKKAMEDALGDTDYYDCFNSNPDPGQMWE